MVNNRLIFIYFYMYIWDLKQNNIKIFLALYVTVDQEILYLGILGFFYNII